MVSCDDPLLLALRPPKNETTAQREQRIKAEQEAIKVSKAIDKELDRERAEKKKRKDEIKVLLLGPSCAGKSTALKNFQLAFTPQALQAEAATYASLVFLNVVSSVRLLRDILDEHRNDPSATPLPEELHQRAMRLQTVIDLEPSLTRCVGDSLSQTRSYTANESAYELSVRSGGLWRMLKSSHQSRSSLSTMSEEGEHARVVLAERSGDVEALVGHPQLRKLLAGRGLQLAHLPGYFLDDLKRITAPDYTPSDDDILRTRIRTLGVSEMRFSPESGRDMGRTWVIVDVGGARHQRAAWVPYFDDASAVIFMAPIGHFDQFLEEDPSVNCIRDSLELWESIVSQKLLGNAEFILFLNKHDIMKQKLDAGVEFSSFVTSYKDVNDAESVRNYLQKTFAMIHKQRSPNPRKLHCHFTSATDKSSTAALIAHFRVVVLQSHLRATTLL